MPSKRTYEIKSIDLTKPFIARDIRFLNIEHQEMVADRGEDQDRKFQNWDEMLDLFSLNPRIGYITFEVYVNDHDVDGIYDIDGFNMFTIEKTEWKSFYIHQVVGWSHGE